MNKIKFAVVGCEHAHIEIFIQEMLALGHDCAGLYEPANRKLAKAVSEKFHIPIVLNRDLLLQEADIVGSSAINNEKIDLIEECENLGKHIMVDKPIATNRRDLERLQAIVNRRKIEVGMLLTERFDPAVCTLKKQIDQGVLGQLISIGVRKPHLLNPAGRPQWFFSKEQCGGVIIDLLVHDYDLLRWFTGKEVVQSTGYLVKRMMPEYPGFYDAASLQVMMEGDMIAQLYADWYTPAKSLTWGDGRIFVTGASGFAELRSTGDPFIKQEAYLILTTNTEAPVQVELEHPSVNITEDFLNRIAGKLHVLSSNDIAAAAKATIDADEQAHVLRSAMQ